MTMDPELVEGAITDRTRALMPVHIYGQPAAMSPLKSISERHGLALIEDASQAHGATWRGCSVGSIGDVGIFSCYPTKNLGALGDAGVIVTSNDATAARMRALRQYGWAKRNWSVEPGVNSRLDELQAAVLRVKLRRLDETNGRRRELAVGYERLLAGLPVILPSTSPERGHVFHLYVVSVEDRDEVSVRLDEMGVQTSVHYPTPIHLQPAYMGRIRCPGGMRVTETAARRVLSLPMYPELKSAHQEAVAEALGVLIGEGS